MSRQLSAAIAITTICSLSGALAAHAPTNLSTPFSPDTSVSCNTGLKGLLGKSGIPIVDERQTAPQYQGSHVVSYKLPAYLRYNPLYHQVYQELSSKLDREIATDDDVPRCIRCGPGGIRKTYLASSKRL